MNSNRLIAFSELTILGVPYSRSHLTRLIEQGRFPRPVKTGPARQNRVFFIESEIKEWVANLLAQRSAA